MASNHLRTASWIQKTPGVCGGDACVRNTRIAVWMLVESRLLGMSDERIRNDFDPPLTQADLDTAWEYYAQHRQEIEQALRENDLDAPEDG